MDMQKLWERFNETKMYKDRWLALYQQLYNFVIPDRDAFNVKWNYRDDGKPVTVQIWDNTAVLSAYQRANDLHALLMPKDRTWGKLVADPHMFSPTEIDALKPTLDDINDRVFFYLNESNLARVISSSNLDLVGGTGVLWVESIDDETPLYFRSIPAVTTYIEYSSDDVLNTCWVQVKMTGRQVREAFPKYQGQGLGSLIENPNNIYIVLYGQIKRNENSFWMYAILQDIDPYTPLWEKERSYPQIIIYRDRVRPGESDGRGVGIDLLPTIIDLNKLVEYDRKSQEFKAYPPMFYDSDAYFNPYSVRQWAGTMIARNPQRKRNPVEAMNIPTHPDTMQQILHLQDTIRSGFMVDPLGEINAPTKSATEVSIRENRAQRTATTDISRLINECPKQIYVVSSKILAERRLLKKDRSIGAINTKKLSFAFQSPLFDLQKQDELNHFITNMQIKQQFFGQQAAMASLNMEETEKFLTNNLNLPSKLFATPEQMRQLMQTLMQAHQAQQQGALPTPTTTAGKVNFPQQSQEQF
jgi:hypothetical protein